MADVETNPPGTFCWPELTTSDQKGAVAFYTALFGWGVNEAPVGPDEVYSMFQLRNRSVAAACTLRPEQKTQGVPPHWGSYVAVANADQAAARARQPHEAHLAGDDLAVPVLVQPLEHRGAAFERLLQVPARHAERRRPVRLFGRAHGLGADREQLLARHAEELRRMLVAVHEPSGAHVEHDHGFRRVLDQGDGSLGAA